MVKTFSLSEALHITSRLSRDRKCQGITRASPAARPFNQDAMFYQVLDISEGKRGRSRQMDILPVGRMGHVVYFIYK